MASERSEISYPERSALIAGMCSILKAARRSLTEEWKRFDLDREGWNLLGQLADRLMHHLHFEHLDREELRRALHDAVRRYKNAPAGQRPANAQFAADVWTPTGFVDTIRSGTMVYEERTGSGTGSQEVHPGI